jgi:hypothetical protein
MKKTKEAGIVLANYAAEEHRERALELIVKAGVYFKAIEKAVSWGM